jgi:hypothetical protein
MTATTRTNEAIEDIAAAAKDAGGLLVVPMSRLRDAANYGKLGKLVVQNIATRLDREGLGHLPVGELPREQNAQVRVYLKASRVGELIEAVLNPSRRGDQRLLDAAGSDAGEILEQIRALVTTD